MKSHYMIANPEQAGLDFGSDHRYQVRRSKRAKHLRINIHPQTGVEVVLPERMSERHVSPFVQQNSEWINHQIKQLGMDRPVSLPETIHLLMNDEVWQVQYELTDSTRFRLYEKHRQLVISGPDQGLEACRVQLHRWLRKKACELLPEKLDSLSQSTGLPCNRLSIRSQKTRWGSCSARGNINLNDRLVLLPSELVGYVIIHELCHTRELNHSPAFWKLVEHHCPDYRTHRQNLRRARQHLPGWI